MTSVNISLEKALADRWLACAKTMNMSAKDLLESLLDALEDKPEAEPEAVEAPKEPDPEPQEPEPDPSYGAPILGLSQFAKLAGWSASKAASMISYLDSQVLRTNKIREHLKDPQTGKTWVYAYKSPWNGTASQRLFQRVDGIVR